MTMTMAITIIMTMISMTLINMMMAICGDGEKRKIMIIVLPKYLMIHHLNLITNNHR